ncbi:hypothetical protein B7C51_14105 [Paenibacillus larvae subsp. pulvifaciens]|uniref:Toxin-like protein n=1 Tax=Paenibacillus larvae subsp. pulvifaciens TaxID=1477 RepID=A0A1V0UUJ9_9BACL|nr:hypothetical protein [Paenibacillus larvae]ARF68692.1 hypothetical protein B7C51_14105 [Paenibacillus larvae subsp. pulvifaciens]
MKKKILVLTTALSLILASLVPITSLAATQKGTKAATFIAAETTDAEARKMAEKHARYLINSFINEINKAGRKLGYLKGSKLTVKVDGKVYGEDLRAFDDNIAFTGKTIAKKVTATGDPTIHVSYNTSKEEFTIERIKNSKSTGNLKLEMEVDYAFATWEWYGAWYRVNDRIGTTSDSQSLRFTNFEEAPKLQIDSKTNVHEVNLNSNVKPEDFYNVKNSAGEVKSEFIKKPDFTHIGKQTTTIHVWDEYGEEDRNDNDHNRTFDVTFNVVDKSTWKDKNLRDWQFVSGNKWGIVEDPDNSLTDDHVIYSNDSIKALKNYSLEKGATYKFTAFIKPDVLSTRDKMALSLIPGRSSSKKREIFSSNSYDLPSVDKGFKEVSKEFTLGDDEENLTFEFFANFRDKGGYIDSFKLERIK